MGGVKAHFSEKRKQNFSRISLAAWSALNGFTNFDFCRSENQDP